MRVEFYGNVRQYNRIKDEIDKNITACKREREERLYPGYLPVEQI